MSCDTSQRSARAACRGSGLPPAQVLAAAQTRAGKLTALFAGQAQRDRQAMQKRLGRGLRGQLAVLDATERAAFLAKLAQQEDADVSDAAWTLLAERVAGGDLAAWEALATLGRTNGLLPQEAESIAARAAELLDRTLRKLEPARARAMLQASLRHPSAMLRLYAAEQLHPHAAEPEVAAALLAQLAQEHSDPVCAALARALASPTHPVVRRAILRLVDSGHVPSASEGVCLARPLALAGDQEAVEAIARVLLRRAAPFMDAIYTLSEIAQTPQVRGRLLGILRAPAPTSYTHHWAASVLRSQAQAGDREVVEAVLRTYPLAVQSGDEEAVYVARQTLYDLESSPAARAAVAEIVAGDASLAHALPAGMRAVKDKAGR